MSVPNWIAKMTVAQRATAAKEKTRLVVDHLLYLLALHENNAIVVYSSTLAQQIPTSFAANAFNVFQQAVHHLEIVRLCALWDGVDPQKQNIPTIIELIDHRDVIESLAQETASHWQEPVVVSNPSSDPELRRLEEEALRRSNERFGQEQAQEARDALGKAITDSRAILASSKYASIMNLRDKHLAHSLSQTWREKAGPLPPMKYGDERNMLEATLPIVEVLYCWVNGISMSIADSRDIGRKNAKALWEACTFNITR
jgi:hypothetical protein